MGLFDNIVENVRKDIASQRKSNRYVSPTVSFHKSLEEDWELEQARIKRDVDALIEGWFGKKDSK